MIPLILGAIALGTAAFGAVKGAEGFGNMNEAKEIGERAQNRHSYAVSEFNLYHHSTKTGTLVSFKKSHFLLRHLQKS